MEYLYYLANASLTLRLIEYLHGKPHLNVKCVTVINQVDGWVVNVQITSALNSQQHGDIRAFLNELGIAYTPPQRVTLASESLVANAIALLNQSQADCVLIVEDWQLLGIFTERDVVRLAASGKDLSKLKLFEVIARPVITMTQSNSQDPFTALSLMRQHQIRHIPISRQARALGRTGDADELAASAHFAGNV